MAERDRKFADSNWGIKPDDQPANAADAGKHSVSTYLYDPSEPNAIRNILIAQRRGFNTANRVRIEACRTVIIDINKDEFIVDGLGFGDPQLPELLMHLGAAFNPHELTAAAAGEKTPREYALSRVWAWGAERSG